MGLHLIPLLAAGAAGAFLVNQTSKQKNLLHDTAVNITAEALNIKDSLEKDFEDIKEKAETKKNKESIDVEIE
ncbi:MAG: hypothetical protein IJJ47_13030 [Methanosphaera sp.]|nr:hypothetical protein [Methanosphaera sp.]